MKSWVLQSGIQPKTVSLHFLGRIPIMLAMFLAGQPAERPLVSFWPMCGQDGGWNPQQWMRCVPESFGRTFSRRHPRLLSDNSFSLSPERMRLLRWSMDIVNVNAHSLHFLWSAEGRVPRQLTNPSFSCIRVPHSLKKRPPPPLGLP